MPNDEVWTETVRQVRTNDSFYYEVGPDPDGLGLELRYLEIDPDTKTAKVHSRVGVLRAARLGALGGDPKGGARLRSE